MKEEVEKLGETRYVYKPDPYQFDKPEAPLVRDASEGTLKPYTPPINPLLIKTDNPPTDDAREKKVSLKIPELNKTHLSTPLSQKPLQTSKNNLADTQLPAHEGPAPGKLREKPQTPVEDHPKLSTVALNKKSAVDIIADQADDLHRSKDSNLPIEPENDRTQSQDSASEAQAASLPLNRLTPDPLYRSPSGYQGGKKNSATSIGQPGQQPASLAGYAPEGYKPYFPGTQQPGLSSEEKKLLEELKSSYLDLKLKLQSQPPGVADMKGTLW